MSFRGKTIVPKYVLVDGKLEEDVAISIDKNGIIKHVGLVSHGAERLEHEVFLPGFVNSHSHAFHRHLRGKSEIGGRAADTFWKWRDNMYSLVDGITEEKLYQYCLSTFQEMIAAGITTVGEFHYVHHGSGRFDLDEAVIRAANKAGIRITLIQTLYERAGFDSPPIHPVQARFISNYDEFITHLQKLLHLKSDTVTIAVAAHSTRAVNLSNIEKLFRFACENRLAFHIHLEEQPKEIIDCRKHHGDDKAPSDILLGMLHPNELFTAVHATYTSPENMAKFTKLGANISICPCTEGYLGDGVPILSEDTNLSFGTDCNNRICFVEEMRWACYSQQMKHNSRSVAGLSATRLLEAATLGGARSLALDNTIGSFQTGKALDVVSFDLRSPLLAGLDGSSLIDGIVFSAGNREIRRVVVAGETKYEAKQ